MDVMTLATVDSTILEVGASILRHVERGSISVRAVENQDRRGLEVVTIDHGHRSPDVGQTIQNGSPAGAELRLDGRRTTRV
jgi:hypothetical protein